MWYVYRGSRASLRSLRGGSRVPGGLGGRRAAVAEHEPEGAGEGVGRGAAAVLLPDREQEEQQQ